MPKIKLIINDRPYEISCNAGDEEHIASLAESINIRVGKATRNMTHASEGMALVVASLMMEDEIRSLQSGKDVPAPQYDETAIQMRINRAIIDALAPFTEKLESLANRLEVE